MKIITIIIRTVLGLYFLYLFFLYLSPEPASTGEFKAFQVGLMASTYLFPKSVEFYVVCNWKIYNIIESCYFPVTLNILLINYLTPENLPLAILYS
jgi:hypothetical protein